MGNDRPNKRPEDDEDELRDEKRDTNAESDYPSHGHTNNNAERSWEVFANDCRAGKVPISFESVNFIMENAPPWEEQENIDTTENGTVEDNTGAAGGQDPFEQTNESIDE